MELIGVIGLVVGAVFGLLLIAYRDSKWKTGLCTGCRERVRARRNGDRYECHNCGYQGKLNG